ncbi:MAG: sortase [Patescibacteria group bacterium]|nr:sortase [Patescibacteria group bacterium]
MNYDLSQQNEGSPKHVGPWKFLAVFLVIFFLISAFLYAIDFVPDVPASQQALTNTTTPATAVGQWPTESPVRIVASAVGIDAPIENPTSTNLTTLDNELLQGAVRYPGSGLLGENARMYIFGHQSYLPFLHNPAYKTFDGLQQLRAGDDITVFSATAAYHYRVATVTHTTAAAGVVQLGTGARTLTLSTCDAFGSTSDRWEVVAEFVSRTPLTNNAS